MSRPQGEDDGSVLKYMTEDEPQRARQIPLNSVSLNNVFQVWRVREMSRPQGEDDGSVLKYVTEDELQRARQIARYTNLESKLESARDVK